MNSSVALLFVGIAGAGQGRVRCRVLQIGGVATESPNLWTKSLSPLPSPKRITKKATQFPESLPVGAEGVEPPTMASHRLTSNPQSLRDSPTGACRCRLSRHRASPHLRFFETAVLRCAAEAAYYRGSGVREDMTKKAIQFPESLPVGAEGVEPPTLCL